MQQLVLELASPPAPAFDNFFSARNAHVLAALQRLAAVTTDHLIELDSRGRDRIFNLGYYTWVEQQGIPLAEFEARRSQSFWRGLRDLVPAWDALIDAFNAKAERAA